jgi:hypothetical protein
MSNLAWFTKDEDKEAIIALLLLRINDQVDFTKEELETIKNEFEVYDGRISETNMYRLTALPKGTGAALSEAME